MLSSFLFLTVFVVYLSHWGLLETLNSLPVVRTRSARFLNLEAHAGSLLCYPSLNKTSPLSV